ERCTEQELEHRHADFGPVLAVLEALDPQTAGHQPQAAEPRGGGPRADERRPEASQRSEGWQWADYLATFFRERLRPEDQPREVHVSVPGEWFVRPADRLDLSWTKVTQTPARVAVSPGEVYQLKVAPGATDPELDGLAGLRRLPNLQALDLAG